MTGLNDALENVVVVKNYLYSQGDNWYADLLDEAADALALLKEQEAVEPLRPRARGRVERFWVCGECGAEIDKGDGFCRYCGRETKWED